MDAPPGPRCGIVGGGRSRNGLGPFLARDLEAAGAHVAAVAGRDLERARAAARALERRLGHPVAAHASIEALLAEGGLDALVVAAPIPVHLPALRAALAAGVPVLCEKPLVLPEEHDLVPGLLDEFARRGLLLMENCQWPYALPVVERLFPGLLGGPVERIEMLTSPVGRGQFMLVDSLSHFLSVIQYLLPVEATTRVEQRVSEPCAPDQQDLELHVVLETPFPAVRAALYLRHCAAQPRPAWIEINGKRVERHIRPHDYAISFSGGGRVAPVEDPLTALVSRFVHLLRNPDLDRTRAESALVRERARLYRAILEGRPSGERPTRR